MQSHGFVWMQACISSKGSLIDCHRTCTFISYSTAPAAYQQTIVRRLCPPTADASGRSCYQPA